MRKINQDGLDLIKNFEAFSSKPYLDAAKIPTIGYGTTAYPNGEKVRLTDSMITRSDAELLLEDDLEERCAIVDSFLIKNRIVLNDNQFSALISFAYNCGLRPILEDGRSMNFALKTRDALEVASAFLLYNKITKTFLGVKRKVELPGLTRRRNAEKNLFLK